MPAGKYIGQRGGALLADLEICAEAAIQSERRATLGAIDTTPSLQPTLKRKQCLIPRTLLRWKNPRAETLTLAFMRRRGRRRREGRISLFRW
jgi:hypothetical protein